MKNQKLLVLLLCICLQGCCPFLVDCEDDDFIERSSRYEPILMDRSDFEASVNLTSPLAIGTSGKIYVKDQLLFINELNKGFHIYDNSDPSNPVAVKFLNAPGATDLAIRDNIMYINQATDLIAVQYNAANTTVVLTKRIANTFPQLRSPDGFEAFDVPENAVVIDWKPIN